MTSKIVSVPELAMIGGTRAALGAGVALLLGDRLNPEQRRAVGWTLLAVGAISTIPLAAEVMFRQARPPSAAHGSTTPSQEPQEMVGQRW